MVVNGGREVVVNGRVSHERARGDAQPGVCVCVCVCVYVYVCVSVCVSERKREREIPSR